MKIIGHDHSLVKFLKEIAGKLDTDLVKFLVKPKPRRNSSAYFEKMGI
jgi:hypothetical protein